MYCPNCGFNMADGSKFCSQCASPMAGGVPVNNYQPRYDYQAEKKAIRQSEEAEIAKVYKYFSQKQAEFDEYDSVCNIINVCRNTSFASRIRFWSIVVGVSLTLIFVVFPLIIDVDAIGISLLLFSPLLVPGIYIIISSIIKEVSNKRLLAMAEERYAELAQELYTHYCNYPNCPIGISYANPQIIYQIITILQSGRADTIKESLNVIIADENSSVLAARLSNLQATVDQINANAANAAAFAAANFFFN